MFRKSISILISCVVFTISCGLVLADCPSADLTGDCWVDFEDFAVMVNQWLTGDPNLSDQVQIPAGEFPYQNGDPCYVDAFWIDQYELTNLFYCQFLNAADPCGGHWDINQEILRLGDPGSYTYIVQPGKDNYPIRYVSFYDAEAFAAWRSSTEGKSYRLPTEHEWEKAAGWDPVQQHHYTYGYHQDIHGCGWMNYNNCYGGPLPVGSFDGTGGKENARCYYGCYDMSGNVWEWTSSYSSEERIIRGGSYLSGAETEHTTVTFRLSYNPSNRRHDIGFRLVHDSN